MLAGTDTFVPIGRTVWQYKAERKPPGEGELRAEIEKPRPKTVLEAGGNYRFIAQQPRVNESTKDDELRRIAREKGYKPNQVKFCAQATLTERARQYPSLALLPFFHRPLEQVHPFGWWAQQHSGTQFDTQSRADKLDELLEFLKGSIRPAHVRVVGPAGVGKTRLALHALTQLDLGACTVYAPNPNASGFSAFFKWCAEHKARLVIVVDECDEAAAMSLRSSCVEHELPIVLVTINKVEDREITPIGGDLRVHVDPMSEADIVRILEGSTPLDKRTAFAIAHITGGFVKLARVVATAIARGGAGELDFSALVAVDVIRDAVGSLLGGSADALRWFGVMALFSDIRNDSAEEGSDLALLSSFAGVPIQSVRTWNRKGLTEQVLSDRGGRVFVTPLLLAVLLARDAIRERKEDLAPWLHRLPVRLKEAFVSQVGQLRYSKEGHELARELINVNGPFGNLLAERQPWARDAFLALGTVAKNEALSQLETWMAEAEFAGSDLSADSKLERLLFRLIWRPEHFARTFRLILRGLECAEDPSRSGLQRVMSGSLRIVLANSQAPFPDRLAVAARAVRDRSARTEVRRLILRALAAGVGNAGGDGYSDEDVDVGGRKYWHPKTYGEWWECTRSVVNLLVETLSDPDKGMQHEAAANLIDHAADFVQGGAHEPLLSVVTQILAIDPRVGTLREELERCIAFDRIAPDVALAVRAAIATLPQDLPSRIRVLVEGWPLVTDREERGLPHRPKEADVASEIMCSASREDMISLLFESWAKNTGGIITALALHEDSAQAWPLVLAAARRSRETWAAALFLAVAHDAGDESLRDVAVQLLDSSESYERDLGAEAITRMEASDEEVGALVRAVQSGRVPPSSIRYAIIGRWAERRSATVVSELIRATAAREDGRVAALAIAHAAEENLTLSDAELIGVLTASMFAVKGHDAWTWEQVGISVAKRAPLALGEALIDAVGLEGDGPERRYTFWAKEEVSRVLERCINREPDLVRELLDLWDRSADFVESFGSAPLLSLDAQTLGDWANDSRRQEALARIVLAGPHSTTEALLERFGAASPFASRLREQLYPRAWSGSLANLLRARAAEAQTWSSDLSKPHEFREWARTAAVWLADVAQGAERFDD